MSETLKSTWPRARIPHGCDECGRTIQVGETYWRWEGIDDYGDGIVTQKLCTQCIDAWKTLDATDLVFYEPGEGWPIGWLIESLTEEGLADEPVVRPIIEGIRTQWAARGETQ